jgi:multicomponent Na+:H+ antiporter subunit D
MFIGTLSMIVGVLLAIGQFDLKRLLAHHSISQVGYIMLGIGIGTPLGILGGLFHLFNHSIFKSLLFLNSGAIEYATGTRDLNKMGGLNAKMPVTGKTSLFASMAIAGIPPFNGFFSKLLIIFAAVQAGYMGYAFCAVLASLLTLASFMKVQKYAFFGNLNEELIDVKEVPLFMKSAMIALAIICLLGGLLLAPAIADKFLIPASEALSAGKNYAVSVFKSIGP